MEGGARRGSEKSRGGGPPGGLCIMFANSCRQVEFLSAVYSGMLGGLGSASMGAQVVWRRSGPDICPSTPVGFEPTRGDPIGLAGRRLSHSAKVSLQSATLCQYSSSLIPVCLL